MTTMISEVYDALREAGASEVKSQAAAEAVANLNDRLGTIEAKLTMIQWALSGVGFGVLLLVIRAFAPG